MTEDAQVFGDDKMVYCFSHLRPHKTGWCTVPASDKVALGVENYEEACEKCRHLKLRIFDDVE